MYRFIEDPGHGWLEVPLAEVRAMNVTVSRYSYQSGDMAYLEEDVDMPRFVAAKHWAGEDVPMRHEFQAETAIRYMRHFEGA